VTGTYAIKGPFWALSTEWLSASTAAADIAQINAIGNLDGFVATYLLGDDQGCDRQLRARAVAAGRADCRGQHRVLVMGRGHPRAVAAAPAR